MIFSVFAVIVPFMFYKRKTLPSRWKRNEINAELAALKNIAVLNQYKTLVLQQLEFYFSFEGVTGKDYESVARDYLAGLREGLVSIKPYSYQEEEYCNQLMAIEALEEKLGNFSAMNNTGEKDVLLSLAASVRDCTKSIMSFLKIELIINENDISVNRQFVEYN